MAENIQALIDLLSEEILKYDLSHIKGEEIVNGNPEHCINLLQLAKEISLMMQTNERPPNMDQGSEEEEDGRNALGSSDRRRLGGISVSEDQEEFNDFNNDEDDEEALQMEDVSINLEEGLPSSDDI